MSKNFVATKESRFKDKKGDDFQSGDPNGACISKHVWASSQSDIAVAC